MNNRRGTGPARVNGGRCDLCNDGSVHCATHCPSFRSGANRGRGFAQRRVIPEARSRSPAPVLPSSRTPSTDEPLGQGTDNAQEPAIREGRRNERHAIRSSLLAQWRLFGDDLGSRPLPTTGRHANLVSGRTWREALRSPRTRELLRSHEWITNRRHSSVHLTLFLEWAERGLAEQSSRRCGGLELGRHILTFTGASP